MVDKQTKPTPTQQNGRDPTLKRPSGNGRGARCTPRSDFTLSGVGELEISAGRGFQAVMVATLMLRPRESEFGTRDDKETSIVWV